ncbi:preprotein translocase subunit SecG [Atopobacter sp. AH10]|uniref:preprotein translocase subunit SecG n=1 Tax=Atopobacter sp. AH10 TaxID=2315861 RepID=UPI000EF291B3|nr:preprotein translocase subunit SecG [Atopobacter sp. AH10]RLK64076.1 preprotein translocase subunit SecG [Atopobacter sp. AH10]
MYSVLLSVLIVLSVLLIIVVAMQPSKTNAASSLSGGAEQLFGKQKARGFESFLIRLTVVLGTIFLVLTLALEYLINH